jgi:hypothetical protein
MSEQDTVVTDTLHKLGFPPPGAPSTWRDWESWPTVRKLELAYYAAEARQSGSGDALLRKVTRVIAASHIDAIRHEPALARYFPEPMGVAIMEAPQRFAFSVPTPGAVGEALPPQLRNVVKIVSRYTDGASSAAVLSRCCAISEDEHYELARKSASMEEMLEAGLLKHPPPPTIEVKTKRMVDTAHRLNPTLAYEPGLAGPGGSIHPRPFAEREVGSIDDGLSDQLTGQALDNMTRHDPPGGGGGGGGGQHPFAERSYHAFERASYSGRSARSFRTMVRRSGGFGGVIFGNAVSPFNPAKLESVYWISGASAASPTAPDVKEPWGRFGFLTANGEILTSKLLRADTALAAQRMAYDNGPTDGTDDGLGLVGFVGRFASNTGFAYIVNPKIVDTRVGRALIALDTLPQQPDVLLSQLSKSDVAAQDVDRLKHLFYSKLGQYKWTDPPLEILRIGLLVTVRRQQDRQASYDPDLREMAFLSLSTFDQDKPRAEAPNSAFDVYPLVPALVSATDAFARANEFSEAFALLRAARKAGAVWKSVPPPAKLLAPATAVLIDGYNGDAEMIYAASPFSVELALVAEYSETASKIAADSGSPALTVETGTITKGILKVQVMRSALRYGLGPYAYLEAQYADGAPLALAHPDIAARVQAIALSADDPADDSWMQANLKRLATMTPGFADRLVQQAEVETAVLDVYRRTSPEALCGKVFAQFDQGECVKMLESYGQVDDCCQALDKSVPGFLRWYKAVSDMMETV